MDFTVFQTETGGKITVYMDTKPNRVRVWSARTRSTTRWYTVPEYSMQSNKNMAVHSIQINQMYENYDKFCNVIFDPIICISIIKMGQGAPQDDMLFLNRFCNLITCHDETLNMVKSGVWKLWLMFSCCTWGNLSVSVAVCRGSTL